MDKKQCLPQAHRGIKSANIEEDKISGELVAADVSTDPAAIIKAYNVKFVGVTQLDNLPA